MVCVMFKNRGSQLFLMPLEVLTEEGFRRLIDHKAAQVFDGNGFKFITAYKEPVNPSVIRVEVKYEKLRSRAVEILAICVNKLGGNFFGLDMGPIYSARGLITPQNNSNQILGFEDVEDLRYRIFGSRRLYHAFLHALDQQKLSESISEAEYLGVIERVDSRFKKMYCEWKNAPLLYKKQTLREFREVFENDPLISPHLRMAKEIVQSQK